jgi:hypothetical protein
MNTELFLVKEEFDDLEIETADGVVLFTSRGWLYHTSAYFKTLLLSKCKESFENRIHLEYSSDIILYLFKYIFYASHKDANTFHKNIFDSIDNIDHICDFFNICNEYDFQHISQIFENHLINNKKLCAIYCNDLLSTINKLNLSLLKAELKKLFGEKKINILDYGQMKYNSMSFDILIFLISIFSDWISIANILYLWSQTNKMTDDDFFNKSTLYQYNYDKLPMKYIPQMLITLDNLSNDKITSHIIKKLTKSNYHLGLSHNNYDSPENNKLLDIVMDKIKSYKNIYLIIFSSNSMLFKITLNNDVHIIKLSHSAHIIISELTDVNKFTFIEDINKKLLPCYSDSVESILNIFENEKVLIK